MSHPVNAPAPLGIVVVNFGSHRLLADNLARVDHEAARARVVVVDSFHSDTEREVIRRLAATEGWDLVEPDSNVGFGIGMNLGVARARGHGCEVFLLLNPDVEIDQPTVVALRDQGLSSPRVMVSPLVTRPDGTVWFKGGDILLERGRTAAGDGLLRTGSIPWLSGACLLVPGPLWQQLGGFDEDFFLYWEDVELSYRCHLLGAGVAVRDDLRVIHSVGGTQGAGRAKSGLYYYYNARNRLLFAAKHLSSRLILRWVLFTPAFAREVVLRGGRRQLLSPWKPVSAVVRGSASGLRFAGSALRRHRRSAIGGPSGQAR